MPSVEERTIIVTGASRGLGRTIATRFGAAGHRVVITFSTSEADARSVEASINDSGGTALALRADIRDPAAVDRMIASVLDRWGRIDVLVNNAGITRDRLILRMSEQDWDDVLDTDLKGPILIIRSVAPIMMEQRSGHLINISSIAGVQGREGQANYSAAKAGLIGITKTLARELGRYDIKANVVLPGFLGTAMGNSATASAAERIVGENTLGRPSNTGEVAEFIYQLSRMQNISGQVFNLDSRII